MNWNQALFPSLKRRGGCATKKMSQSNLSSRRRGGQIGEIFRPEGFFELTTPSAALRRLRAFLLMPQPPLLFKEGNVSALKQSVNSFTPSKAGAYTLSDSASCDRHVRRRYLVPCESQCLVGSRCIRFVLAVLASM